MTPDKQAAKTIQGVILKPLKQISDERGKIMHFLKTTDPEFEKFGEAYFSVVYPGMVKGWHLHREQVQFYAVVSGMIKLVLFDDRPTSPTRGVLMELFVGESNYQLVRIPTGVINGFKGVGTAPAIVANCATLPHDSNEIERFDPLGDKVPYKWDAVFR